MIFTGGYRVGEIIWKELMWLSWRMTITRQRKKKMTILVNLLCARHCAGYFIFSKPLTFYTLRKWALLPIFFIWRIWLRGKVGAWSQVTQNGASVPRPSGPQGSCPSLVPNCVSLPAKEIRHAYAVLIFSPVRGRVGTGQQKVEFFRFVEPQSFSIYVEHFLHPVYRVKHALSLCNCSWGCNSYLYC